MTIESFGHALDIWITQYMAVFSLITILGWALGSFLWMKKWERQVRDAGLYFLSIGMLTLLLAIRPALESDAVFWSPIAWFCFSMLLMLELLWISYIIENCWRYMQRYYATMPRRQPTRKSPPRATTYR